MFLGKILVHVSKESGTSMKNNSEYTLTDIANHIFIIKKFSNVF